jgi:hypothetical protein
LKVAKKEQMDGENMVMDDEQSALDPVTRLFEVEIESTVVNTESEAEPEKT